MSAVSCSIDMHDNNYFGLCLEDKVQLFGELKKNFKKATSVQGKKKTKHSAKLRMNYHMDIVANEMNA